MPFITVANQAIRNPLTKFQKNRSESSHGCHNKQQQTTDSYYPIVPGGKSARDKKATIVIFCWNFQLHRPSLCHLRTLQCLHPPAQKKKEFGSITVVKRKDTNTKMQVEFICTQFLNELSQKVRVAQVLMEIERSSNPEQPGLSSSIDLEVVCI